MIPNDKSLGYSRCVPAGLTPADSCRAASDVATAPFIRVIRTIRGFFAWCRRNKVLVANHIRRMGAAFGALRAIFRGPFGLSRCGGILYAWLMPRANRLRGEGGVFHVLQETTLRYGRERGPK